VILGGGLAGVALVGLVAANGLSSDWETPEEGTTDVEAHTEPVSEVRVLAYNLARSAPSERSRCARSKR